MKKSVSLLLLLSVVIYSLQLIIFKDPQTTVFYIFQDMAFMPFTIAIATIVVGEVMGAKEKKERMEKTQMLTSSFFTEIGAALLIEWTKVAEYDEALRNAFTEEFIQDEASVVNIQKLIEKSKIKIHLNEEVYTNVQKIILERRTVLHIIASNPLLLDHEEFTKMLWGVLHLVDEFRIRGEFEALSPEDIAHMENDMAEELKLVLSCWSGNILYMKKQYPNFYNTAMNKIALRQVNKSTVN